MPSAKDLLDRIQKIEDDNATLDWYPFPTAESPCELQIKRLKREEAVKLVYQSKHKNAPLNQFTSREKDVIEYRDKLYRKCQLNWRGMTAGLFEDIINAERPVGRKVDLGYSREDVVDFDLRLAFTLSDYSEAFSSFVALTATQAADLETELEVKKNVIS